MGLRVRFNPVARELLVRVNEMQPEAARIRGDFAAARIAEADEINRRKLGRVPTKHVTVDGRPDARLSSVKPNGVIIAEWELFVEVLQWIGTELRKRSPVTSGDYVRSHLLFADGNEIPLTSQPEPATEYVFLNPVPYARKIEIGKTKSGRNFVIQVPNRIYEGVARDAKGRFGNQASIRFTYQDPVGAYRLRQNQVSRRFLSGGRVYREPGQRADRVAGSPVRAPAIIVTLR